MEDRTDQERSNANMNSLVENQVNADAPLLAKLDEIRSLLAEEPRCGRFEAMTKCDELRALVVPPAKQERFARKFKAQKKDQLHGVLDARAELDKDTLETLSVYVGEEMTDDQTLAVHAYAEAERDFGKPLSGSADDRVQEALFLLETYNLRNTYDLTHPEFFKLFVVTLKKTKTKDVVRAELPDIVQEALRTGGPSLTHEDLAFALTALLRIKKLNGTPWSESSDNQVRQVGARRVQGTTQGEGRSPQVEGRAAQVEHGVGRVKGRAREGQAGAEGQAPRLRHQRLIDSPPGA